MLLTPVPEGIEGVSAPLAAVLVSKDVPKEETKTELSGVAGGLSLPTRGLPVNEGDDVDEGTGAVAIGGV